MATAETCNEERIVLAHGGGGILTKRLIEERLLPVLGNDLLNPLTDSAVLSLAGQVAFTTDGYTVQPLEFPGGDIGRLAVCGTVNDLAVAGASPAALSLGMIIEEGLPVALLDRIVKSIADAAAEAGVVIATGDTKVVERRGGDGLLITTAGVGQVRAGLDLDASRIDPGDVIIVNGGIAEHGLAIMAAREGLQFSTDMVSDVAPLNTLVDALLDSQADVKFLRDPTRGGLAGVLVDLVESSGYGIEVVESQVPLSRMARHMAELLGLDPLTVANEGKLVAVVSAKDAERVLEACHAHRLGREAAVIGRFVEGQEPPLVELITLSGGRRIVQRPYGEELPRIC